MGSKFRARCCALTIAFGFVAILAVIVLVAVSSSTHGLQHQQQHEGTSFNATIYENQETHVEQIVVTERGDAFVEETTASPDIPVTANGDGFPDEEEEYVEPIKLSRSLHDHDILYDQMRNEHGHPQIRHHSGHFRHKQAEVWDPHPQYEIVAFGRKLILDLTYNDNLSPNLHIIHVWNNYTQRVKHDTVACYYTGTVKGDPNSNVVVSLCNGMTGYIKTSDANYWIQPVEPLRDNSSSSSILHLIRKNGNKQLDNDVNFEQCETETHAFDGGPHRTKRSLDLEHSNVYDDFEDENDPMNYQTSVHSYFVEIMVVMDKKMLQYHKTDAQLIDYVLILMSHVALLFKDASIGNPITLSVVDIMVLRDTGFTGESQEMLRKFCEYQHIHSKNMHDVALLLTRDYLCRNSTTEHHCNTLGVAEVGSMCTPSSSCTIVRDKGLSTSYSIAHELGHVLNMPHDDDNKCAKFMRGTKADKIMSRSFNNETNPWHWSNCSKHYLTEFLDSPRSRCLLDKPKNNYIVSEYPDFPATDILPGEHFEVDKQCELEFGNGSKVCTFMPYCGVLWCTNDGGESSGCITLHMPWGEGTSCGYQQWCHKRECVPLDRNILSPVAGGWSEWKSWSECSRSCGGGIMIAKRDCKNPPPANGGPYCTGGSVRYTSCNIDPCESNEVDFREQQCAAFNGNTKGIPNLPKDVKWVPKYGAGDKDDYCKLFCRVRGYDGYFMLGEKVIDGTKCGLKSFNICVNGVCKKAGCDNKLGSNVTLDGCGVCNGDSSTCEKIVGFYNDTGSYGYNSVTQIPAGSLNIKITQTGDNYLALRDSDTGEYILNGNYIISTYKKEILYGGLTLIYSGSKEVTETVQALHDSRIKKAIAIEILTVKTEQPPNISFTYTMPVKNQPRYKWIYYNANWTACTSICEGVQNPISVCVDTARNQITNSTNCAKASVQIKACNTHCRLSWIITVREECSTECGPGTRKVTYNCIKQSLHTDEHEAVEDKHCHLLDLQQQYESCEGPCDRASWVYSEWSHCAKANNRCNQTRGAKCMGPDHQMLNEVYCAKQGRLVNRECDKSDCPIWLYGEWSPCSVTCGVGYRSRLYSCYLDNLPIDKIYCDSEELEDKEECNVGACYKTNIQWSTTNWGECNVNCGIGEQGRDVFCLSEVEQVNNVYCENNNLLKPNNTRTCKRTCKPQESHHYKKHKSSTAYNSFFDYPNSDNNIIFPSSDYTWQVGKWSECSKSCDGGLRHRLVECIKDTGTAVHSSRCSPKIKPQSTEPCNAHPCPKWILTRWSKCLENCTKQRQIQCHDHSNNIVDESDCNPGGKKRPNTTKNCRKSQCYRNNMTHFGLQSKTVTTYDKDSNFTRTLTWKTGKWSKCCEGDSHKIRTVSCYDKNQEVTLVDALCENANLTRPRWKTICKRRMRCPEVYTWATGHWSECNCDKSNSYQRRSIKCINGRGESANNLSCLKKQKPLHKSTCAYICNNYTSCKAVKTRGRTNKNDDYRLLINGKEAIVHCYKMDTDNPEEFITLKPNSQNYAEIYDKRLNNVKTCPYNGQRNDSCDCHVPMSNHGMTTFWKVRLNITSMQIITNIFTFARGHGSNKEISYGTAGDCYSEIHCPQGRFSIDLTGTSFKIADNVRWVATGSKAPPDIRKDAKKGQRVTGLCGGNCGYCNPDPDIGLNIEIVETIKR